VFQAFLAACPAHTDQTVSGRERGGGRREGRKEDKWPWCVDRDSHYLLYSRNTVGMRNNFNM